MSDLLAADSKLRPKMSLSEFGRDADNIIDFASKRKQLEQEKEEAMYGSLEHLSEDDLKFVTRADDYLGLIIDSISILTGKIPLEELEDWLDRNEDNPREYMVKYLYLLMHAVGSVISYMRKAKGPDFDEDWLSAWEAESVVNTVWMSFRSYVLEDFSDEDMTKVEKIIRSKYHKNLSKLGKSVLDMLYEYGPRSDYYLR